VSRADDRLVDVELVEADEADEADAPDPTRSRRSGTVAVPRRVWVSAAAVAAVGVISIGAVQVVEQAAVDARLAEADGLSASLAEPLVEAWRTDDGEALGVAAGTLLVQTTSRLGDDAVTALDLVTGDVRWTQPGRCQAAVTPADGVVPFPGAARVPELRPDDVLMCVHDSGERPAGGPAGTVTTHDPSTGAVAHTIPLDDVTTYASSVIGTDLVTAGTDGDGRVRAGRWSLRTGERLWDFHSPDTLAAGVDPATGVIFAVSVDEVLVEAGPRKVSLDSATGLPRDDPDDVGRSFPWGPVPLPDGATAVGTFDPDGSTRITVEEADGSTRFTTEGLLLPPAAVDDGTGPPTVLTMDPANGGMVALEAASGRERWRSVVPVGDRAVLSGMVLVTDGSRTTALDLQTGEIRWKSDSTISTSSVMITDGRRVLAVEDLGDGPDLVARDVETGEPAWSIDSPAGSAALRLLPDGTVLATGATDLVALRPPT
jgi:outer membrane protein assembly factor BamB